MKVNDKTKPVTVYTVDGRYMGTYVPETDWQVSLPRGVYIVNGKKMMKNKKIFHM